MVCLGFEPGAAGWKAHTNPLSYGGTPGTYLWGQTTIKHLRCAIIYLWLCRLPTYSKETFVLLVPGWWECEKEREGEREKESAISRERVSLGHSRPEVSLSNKLSLSYNLLSANKKASTPFSRMNFFHGPAFRRIWSIELKRLKLRQSMLLDLKRYSLLLMKWTL